MTQEIRQVTLFDKHRYIVSKGGEDFIFDSVTTILSAVNKPGLIDWYKQAGMNADLLMNLSADRGSRVHQAIDSMLNGWKIILNNPKSPGYTKRQLSSMKKAHIMTQESEYFQVYKAWQLLKSLSFSEVLPERTVASFRHGFAGTLDLYGVIGNDCMIEIGKSKLELFKGQRIIIDWKTGATADEHKCQLAAYSEAIKEELNVKVDFAILVYLNAKTKAGITIKVLTEKELSEEFDKFLVIKKTYDTFFKRETAERMAMPTELSLKI